MNIAVPREIRADETRVALDPESCRKLIALGMEVAVEGKLTHRIFDDKEGKKRYFTEVVMTDLVMLRNKTPEAD